MSKASDDDVAIIAETEADPEPEPEPEIESEPAAVENKDEEMAEVKDAENCEEVDADGEKKIEKEDQDMSDGGEDENDDDNEEGPRLEFLGPGRTVTLQMLLAAKLLEPCKASMTIEYLGQKFVGDLLPDGKIKSIETETIFCSPSAWAMHCKRIINPDKKSGCGWASVKYKGKKLDTIKTTYLRKIQLQKDSNQSDDGDNDMDSKMEPELEIKRIILPFNTVNNKNIVHDPNTLVETVSFASLNKLQPFLVSITTSSVLLMDFHCHLTRKEVCGYLGGTWDNNSHTLAITHAFPVRNSRHDRHMAIEVEQYIQREMLKKNLILVGWYHSHPRIAAQPTLRDCDAQLEYQIKMRGISDATYTPCIGLICAPYYTENPTLESSITAYWVVPPPENRPMEYGRPMLMQFSVSQDAEMTDDIKTEMVLAIDYYRQFDNEMVKFEAKYGDDSTYIEKLKTTLYSKFPREQNDFEFWNWLREHLGLATECEFTPPKWTLREKEEKEAAEAKATIAAANAAAAASQNIIETIEIDDKDTRPESDAKFDSGTDDATVVISDSEKENSSKETSKEDKLLIRSLQEQLSLPSGLNMTPSPISSTLTLLQQQQQQQQQAPQSQLKNSTSSTTISSNTASSVSPRDSPITIPSNSASPAKFEVPLPASPSPAKSDASSTRNRNSPLPANLSKYPSSLTISATSAASDISTRGPTPTHSSSQNASKSHAESNASAAESAKAMQEHLSSSHGHHALGQIDAAWRQFGLSQSKMSSGHDSLAQSMAMFQPPSSSVTKDNNSGHGSSSSAADKFSLSSNAALAAAGLDPSAMTSNMKDFLSQLEKSSELNYLLQSQYQYPGLAGLSHMNVGTGNSGGGAVPSATASNSKSAKQSKRSSRSSSNASQHQRMLEEDANKMKNQYNEYIRSQEYAKMLMEQAEALNAAVAHQSYGDLSSIVSAINTLPTNTSVSASPAPTSSRKSRKASAAQQQQQQQQQQLPPQPSFAEFSQIFQGGSSASVSKVHELLRQMENSAAALSGSNSKQAQKQQMELLSSVTQQLAQASGQSTSSSSSKKGQQQQQQQQQQQAQQQQQQQQNALNDYMSLFSQKMPDLSALMAGQAYGADRSGVGAGNMPSAAELSMLFGSPMGGGNLATSGGGSGSVKGNELASLNASIDMLGNLFSTTGSNKNIVNDINQLLMAQGSKGASAAEISNFLAAAGHQIGTSKGSSSSAASHPYYSQSSSALDKAQQDLIALYNANPIPSSSSGGGGGGGSSSSGNSSKYGSIPDPLSKSTLAANNMFMSPSSIYAKMQQDALNAMIMKPPSKAGSKSESKSRETSASPASRHNRDSPSASQRHPSPSPSTPSPSSVKHNFSVVDLAVSSNPPSSRSPLIKSSSSKHQQDDSHGGSIDAEALALATVQHYSKKRMEFSSIADLVSPPTKMMKYADSLMGSSGGLDLAKSSYGSSSSGGDDKDGVLNLSADNDK